MLRVLQILTFICMPCCLLLIFLWTPPARVLGESSKILYFHVPLAWSAFAAFVVAGTYAMRFLHSRNEHLHYKFHNAVGIGILCITLATLSGSLWAKVSWGHFWNWDPRQTSITLLFMMYIAYYSLHHALTYSPKQGVIAAAYLVIALCVMPLFMFIVPRVMPSLHPSPIINHEQKVHLGSGMLLTLIASLVSFSLLFLYIYCLKNKLSRIEYYNKEEE